MAEGFSEEEEATRWYSIEHPHSIWTEVESSVPYFGVTGSLCRESGNSWHEFHVGSLLK